MILTNIFIGFILVKSIFKYFGIMVSQEKVTKIIKIVEKEPRTIQEISKELGISWVTAEKYVEKLRNNTRLIDIKLIKARYT